MTAFDIEGDHGRLDLRVQALGGKIVTIERNVDHADLFGQAEQLAQALGDPDAAAENADQRWLAMQLWANQIGQLAALRLGIGQGIRKE